MLLLTPSFDARKRPTPTLGLPSVSEANANTPLPIVTIAERQSTSVIFRYIENQTLVFQKPRARYVR